MKRDEESSPANSTNMPLVGLKRSVQDRMAASRAGRALLHLLCAIRRGRWATHLKGIHQEFSSTPRPCVLLQTGQLPVALMCGVILALTSASPAFAATWYVAPTGNDNNAGTLASPFASITRAQTAASSGDTVYIRGGTYTSFTIAFSDSVRNFYHYINKSGISYLAYPGDPRPVFDFSSISPGSKRICAFGVVGHTNTFQGFDVSGVQAGSHPQVDCWRINGNGNTLKLIVNRDAQAYGVYIFGNASNTLVENCDSYNLIGVSGSSAGNTDGFGCHSAGSGNVFRGCRAWACSDDGYDAINNNGGSIMFDRCWAYDNGRHDGNKVGFKIGGYGCSGDSYPNPPPVHEVRFCLSARNGSHEFYANHHPGKCANWYNNTAYDLTGSGFDMLEGNDNGGNCSVAGWREVLHNNITYIAGINNLDQTKSIVNNNSWTLPVTVNSSDFESLDASQMTLPRKADGSLPDITFMKLASGSDLIDQGVNVGFPYNGAAPDLGCFESGAGTPPPSAPTGLAATPVSSSQIDLIWNSSAGATSYNVKQNTVSGGPYTTIATGVTATSYSDAGLSASTAYYYVVSAVNGAGESANSTEAGATTLPDTTPPASPTGLAAAAGDNSVALNWADNAEPDLASYNVKRATTSGGPYTTIATGVVTSDYTDSTAVNGTTYYYVVSAVDTSSNESLNSIEASATPTSAPPSFVASGTIASGTGTITPGLPSGLATGDILLLFVETANQAVSISNPNGGTWAEVAGSPQGTGSAGGSSATRLTAFWSRYNGTQGNPTVSDSGDHQIARMIAIRGAAASGNPWDVTAGGIESASDTSASIPGATTTVANTLVVVAVAGSLPDSNGTSNFSAWSNANLTGLTEQADNTRSSGNGGALGVATGVKTTVGAYGNTTVTHASSAVKGMISIAIKK